VDWRSSSNALLALLLAALALAGCGRFAVRPSEKEHLADRTMRFDADQQEAASEDHVQSNREGSAGGRGTSGGGCGCN
jgi:penicillin V acylase-like amidase (Ntn superfamily)